MADSDDLVYRPQSGQDTTIDDLVYRGPQSDQDGGEVWPQSGIFPSWNTNGVLAAVADMVPSYNSLNMFMTPDQQATIAPLDGAAGGMDGLPGVRPSGWDGDGDVPSAMSLDQGVTPDPDHSAVVQQAGSNSDNGQTPGTQAPVGAVPGFPETGKNSWRAELDDQITQSASTFNTEHGYQPGDPLYMTPQTLKSWVMQESGGSRKAFESDPLQANNPGDWDDAKTKVGLTQGQQMTPDASISGGLGWLQQKADHLAGTNPDVTMSDALRAYNGNTKIDSNGLPHNQNYANSILGRVGSGH